MINCSSFSLIKTRLWRSIFVRNIDDYIELEIGEDKIWIRLLKNRRSFYQILTINSNYYFIKFLSICVYNLHTTESHWRIIESELCMFQCILCWLSTSLWFYEVFMSIVVENQKTKIISSIITERKLLIGLKNDWKFFSRKYLMIISRQRKSNKISNHKSFVTFRYKCDDSTCNNENPNQRLSRIRRRIIIHHNLNNLTTNMDSLFPPSI